MALGSVNQFSGNGQCRIMLRSGVSGEPLTIPRPEQPLVIPELMSQLARHSVNCC